MSYDCLFLHHIPPFTSLPATKTRPGGIYKVGHQKRKQCDPIDKVAGFPSRIHYGFCHLESFIRPRLTTRKFFFPIV